MDIMQWIHESAGRLVRRRRKAFALLAPNTRRFMARFNEQEEIELLLAQAFRHGRDSVRTWPLETMEQSGSSPIDSTPKSD